MIHFLIIWAIASLFFLTVFLILCVSEPIDDKPYLKP